MSVVLIDNSNLINISYSIMLKKVKERGADESPTQNDLGYLFHLYINKIKDYFTTFETVIFCGEGHQSTSWRKKIYPLYKENRKSRGENPDFDLIKECYQKVDDVLKLLPCKSLRIDNCEADDVIYKLSEYFTKKGENVTIISSDKDLTQICNFFDNVTVYDPIKKCNKVVDPNIILEKAIVGDPSDNIAGVPRLGKKTFEKMLQDKTLWTKKMTAENMELYEKILSIVDLRKYPQEYQDNIIKVYESTPFNDFDNEGVEKFFFDYGLKSCLNSWSSISGEIQMMLNGNKQKAAEDDLEDLLQNL